MAEVISHHRTEEAVFASFRETFLVVWRTATTVALVRAMGRHVERFAAAHPSGISMVVVVEEGCEMPDGPTREVMAGDMKRHESFTRHMALVYEGSGFRAAALRSIVAGLHFVSRQKVNTKVLSSVVDAATWLASQPGPNPAAAEIIAAVAEARAPH